MPALFQTASDLEGRSQVLAFKRESSDWTYQELIKGTEGSRSARITNASPLNRL